MNEKNYKVTIEATQTFSPGNVELLVYLLKIFESNSFEVILFLGHDATQKQIQDLNISSINILRSSVLGTFIRSLQKRCNVLFFCSYPALATHRNSIVYYHSSFFFNPVKTIKNKNLSFKVKLSRILIHWVIKLFHKKVDVFFCQTLQMKRELIQNFKNMNVECKPFFNDFDLLEKKNNVKNKKYDFFYPATADAHKNYFKLFDAIIILGKLKKVTLVVTIANDKSSFVHRINEVNIILGYEAIINIGRVPKYKVIEYYNKVKAMVFPSLEESLGLPLIEASTLKLPILGSDLPYLYNVINNPIVFNPSDPNDMAKKMNAFLEGKYENVVQTNKIDNQVGDIINYFKN
jgi:glycosyltransferase involved in cell wall biosynthesis